MIDANPGVLKANVFQHVAVTYNKTTGLARLVLNGVIVNETNLGSRFKSAGWERTLPDSIH